MPVDATTSEPRYFVLQARDADHGSPVLEARFLVTEIEDLRALLGVAAEDDLQLESSYTLDTTELAQVIKRFGVAFDPEGREVHLWPWDAAWENNRHIPYLLHGGYELPLLLEGRKQLARMSDHYPPRYHFNEDKFDRYVAEGLLHKEVVVEPFEPPYRGKDGQVVEGLRTVYYTRKGEEWRIRASKLIWAGAKSGWNEDFERMEGVLFGYEEWQNDWWIADLRKRRRRFGCVPIYRPVGAADLEWIELAGYRALPPTADCALAVSSIYDLTDDDAARRLMECQGAGAAALVHFSVRSRPFLDLVDGQPGPDYVIPAGRIKDLNRNIVGEIEIVARSAARGVAEL